MSLVQTSTFPDSTNRYCIQRSCPILSNAFKSSPKVDVWLRIARAYSWWCISYICWSGRDVAPIKPNIWERGLGEGLGFGEWHWRDGQRQHVTVPHNLTAKLLLLRLSRSFKNPSNSCLLENLNTRAACKPISCIESWDIYTGLFISLWFHANSSFYLVTALLLSGIYYEYANELWALLALLQVMP